MYGKYLMLYSQSILILSESGGLDGPKAPTSGGIGSFKVGSKAKVTPKKEIQKKVLAKKPNNNKKAPVEEKKKTGLWIKTPWSK